jgi:hypothetical protein
MELEHHPQGVALEAVRPGQAEAHLSGRELRALAELGSELGHHAPHAGRELGRRSAHRATRIPSGRRSSHAE